MHKTIGLCAFTTCQAVELSHGGQKGMRNVGTAWLQKVCSSNVIPELFNESALFFRFSKGWGGALHGNQTQKRWCQIANSYCVWLIAMTSWKPNSSSSKDFSDQISRLSLCKCVISKMSASHWPGYLGMLVNGQVTLRRKRLFLLILMD